MVCIQCNGKGYVTDDQLNEGVCPECGGSGEDPSIPKSDFFVRKTLLELADAHSRRESE